jgi:hypothetical protein
VKKQGREGAGKQKLFLFSVPLFLESPVLEDLGLTFAKFTFPVASGSRVLLLWLVLLTKAFVLSGAFF